MAKRWIQRAKAKGEIQEGALTKKADAAGKSVAEFAAEHRDDPGKTGKQARLAETFSRMRKRSPLHDNDRSPKD